MYIDYKQVNAYTVKKHISIDSWYLTYSSTDAQMCYNNKIYHLKFAWLDI